MTTTSSGLVTMLETLVKAFVDHPDSVQASEGSRLDALVVELKVDPEDLGRVIGRQGRTARALRTLVGLAGQKTGRRIILQILE